MAEFNLEQPDFRPEKRITIADVAVDYVRMGKGRPILFLHSVDGLHPSAPFFRDLARDFEVFAPWHPGFGHSQMPREFTSIADLAYFTLEFAEAFDLRDAILMGVSFGGWLACEVAVRSTERFSQLVLLDSFGFKFGGREDREIADMFAVSQDVLTGLAYHDPTKRTRDYSKMTDWERYAIAQSRETYTYLGWKPYMHNPGLRYWLRRVRIPTLVLWGESDGIVTPEYGRKIAALLPDARFQIIPEAGHYPNIEQPDRTANAIRSFVAAGTQARRTA